MNSDHRADVIEATLAYLRTACKLDAKKQPWDAEQRPKRFMSQQLTALEDLFSYILEIGSLGPVDPSPAAPEAPVSRDKIFHKCDNCGKIATATEFDVAGDAGTGGEGEGRR